MKDKVKIIKDFDRAKKGLIGLLKSYIKKKGTIEFSGEPYCLGLAKVDDEVQYVAGAITRINRKGAWFEDIDDPIKIENLDLFCIRYIVGLLLEDESEGGKKFVF